MVIESPPVLKPLATLRLLILGGGAAKVYRSVVTWAEAPAVVVTATSTVAAFSLGAKAVIRVGETTENDRAAMPPKETPVTSVKLVPVIVTISPPAVEPVLTLREATVGSAPAGVIVNWSAGETRS